MKVNQIYGILNDITNEVVGNSVVLQEDLSNIVDIGTAIFDATSTDRFVKTLVDHIGKVVMVDRVYTGRSPSVLMDGWEYGAVLEKITCNTLPTAVENESWELEDGQTYNQDQFYKPSVTAKFFNKRTTFEIDISVTDLQVRSAFSSPTQLNAFFSMIETNVQNSMTVKNDALIMRTINGFTGDTIYNDYNGTGLGTKSGTRAINLLYLYNQTADVKLTAANCLQNAEFLKFAAKTMFDKVEQLANMSTLFNIGKLPRFTPRDRLHVVMHSQFVNAADFYLQSSTFHEQYTELPYHDTVAYWQGTGTAFDFADASKIDVVTPSNNTVQASGILAVMFDRDALGVTNMNPRVTSHYNAKAEFTSMYHKRDAGYFNDYNENFIVFFVA